MFTMDMDMYVVDSLAPFVGSLPPDCHFCGTTNEEKLLPKDFKGLTCQPTISTQTQTEVCVSMDLDFTWLTKSPLYKGLSKLQRKYLQRNPSGPLASYYCSHLTRNQYCPLESCLNWYGPAFFLQNWWRPIRIPMDPLWMPWHPPSGVSMISLVS